MSKVSIIFKGKKLDSFVNGGLLNINTNKGNPYFLWVSWNKRRLVNMGYDSKLCFLASYTASTLPRRLPIVICL